MYIICISYNIYKLHSYTIQTSNIQYLTACKYSYILYSQKISMTKVFIVYIKPLCIAYPPHMTTYIFGQFWMINFSWVFMKP